jgi:glycosyltransferase involved in cell wall biosynthesis
MIKVALLTTDSREHFKDYSNPLPYFGAAPEALLEGFKLIPDDIEVHVVSCLQKAPVSSPEKLAENIYYHALQVPKIGWLKTGYFGCSQAVRRKLGEIKPDIVHGQGTERDCAISAIRSGFSAVLTLHGVMRDLPSPGWSLAGIYYMLARRLEALAISRCDGLICISPRVTSLVAGIAPRSWEIPNAIRPEFLAPRDNFMRPTGPLHLINVGVISPLKRQQELLAILRGLRRTHDFRATFVGRADRTSDYVRSFLAELHATDSDQGKFRHIEWLDPSGLVDLFDEADALLHYSQTESFGLVFAEALARGLPVLTTAVGAIESLPAGVGVRHVAPVGNKAAYTSMLRDWLQGRAPIPQRQPAPVESMARECAPLAVARRHVDVYREVLAT